MKRISWICLSAVLLVAPTLAVVPATQGTAAEPIYLAKATYDQWMRLGYKVTSQRLYNDAAFYFQKALQLRPGDPYATAALRNVRSYIARASRTRSRAAIAYVPSYLGAPGRRVPGATRSGSSCASGEQKLTALIATDVTSTTAAYPAFLVYVPPSTAQALELSLSNQAQEEIYRTSFQPPQQGGVVRLSLPQDGELAPLELDQVYNWSLSLVCDPDEPSANPAVAGKVQRVALDPNLAEMIQQATPAERPALYAPVGIWQDTLDALYQARQANPTDAEIKTDWEESLKQVELGNLAQEPLVPCCTPQAGTP